MIQLSVVHGLAQSRNYLFLVFDKIITEIGKINKKTKQKGENKLKLKVSS